MAGATKVTQLILDGGSLDLSSVAYGMHTGGATTGPCTTCDTFTPVSTALSYFGLALVT